MKAYTDLEQSKKLAEILPTNSADMAYIASATDDDGETLYTAEYKSEIIIKEDDTDYINCWSLAALLDVIPKYIGGSELRIDNGENDFSLWYDEVDAILPDITTNNPVDTCYEMILALHDNDLL